MKFPLPFLIALLIVGCSSGPEPINYGSDQCSYCKMSIADPNYGAELITKKGRILKFDAAECMVSHLEEVPDGHQLLLAVPFDQPNTLVHVDSLSFVISDHYKSPMGANLAAFKSTEKAESSSSFLSWEEVMQRLSTPQ